MDEGLRLAPDLSSPLVQVTPRRVGSFGKIATEDASALLLAITELVTNAVEHGFPFELDDPDQEPVCGIIEVRPERDGNFLRLRVTDDGVGLTDDRGPGDGLGTQIVRTLITAGLAARSTGDVVRKAEPRWSSRCLCARRSEAAAPVTQRQ